MSETKMYLSYINVPKLTVTVLPVINNDGKEQINLL